MSDLDLGLWAPVINAPRKDKSAFGRLPRELRDHVINLLDQGEPLDLAAEYLKGKGCSISRTAISNAYIKLRAARRGELE